MQKSLDEQLLRLIDLQKIDERLFRLNQEIAKKPSEKKVWDDAIASAQADLKKKQESYTQSRMKLKELENDLGSKADKIKKLESQQSQVKTNKEYSALTQEINQIKADQSLVEDQILVLMDQVDTAKAAEEADKKAAQEAEKKYQSEKARIDAELKALESEKKNLEEGRGKHLPEIEKELLAQYARILSKRDGVAIVALSGGSCSGCHLALTPQSVNEVLLGDRIVFCESCSRILYAPKEA